MGLSAKAIEDIALYKLGRSRVDATDLTAVQNALSAVADDVARRYPWSFLERIVTTTTITAGDYQISLPEDFLHLRAVRLIDSDNVVSIIYPQDETEEDYNLPDLDDTGTPNKRWLYVDSGGNYKLELRPISDDSFTVKIYYLKDVSDSYLCIPNPMVLIFGVMELLGKEETMITYKNLYEAGIKEMWEGDRIDRGDEPFMHTSEETQDFNIYQGNLD